jgi:Protein of unknown function (DUF3631)
VKEYTKGQLLAREVDATIRQFIYAPNEQSYTAMTMFILHSHMRNPSGEFLPAHTPRVYFGSKLPGCGKSLALKIVAKLCYNGEVISRPSTAGMITLINQGKATVCFDEIGRFFGRTGRGRDDMMNILEIGYEREGGSIIRVADGRVDRQNVHAPVALAGKNLMDFEHGENFDTVRSRTIVIGLERKPADAYVDTYDNERHGGRLRGLMDRLADWSQSNARTICELEVDEIIPKEIINRDREIWKIFYRIATFIGDEWPTLVDKAARAFVLSSWDEDDTPSIGPAQELLDAVRSTFAGEEEFVSTSEILSRLGRLPTRPALMFEWTTQRSAEMGLSGALKINGAESSRHTFDNAQVMGYTRASLGIPAVADLADLADPQT